MVEGFVDKNFLGIYFVYVSQWNTKKNFRYIYIAQLRYHQEYLYCLYSPDDALVVQNIYIENYFFSVLLWNVYQVYPEKIFIKQIDFFLALPYRTDNWIRTSQWYWTALALRGP